MTFANAQFSEQEFASLFCSPRILVQLFEACLVGSEPQTLTDIVLQDAALSARLIHAARKTRPQLLDPAEPVSSAIQAVGLPVLGGIALQAAKQLLGQDFSAAELHYLNRLWFLSQLSGQAAHCIAPSVGYAHVEEAHLAGTLITLGGQLLFSRHRNAYDQSLSAAPGGTDLRCLDDEIFGIEPLRLAEEAIAGWQLDSFLVDAVRFLPVDAVQIETSNPLLKITRLASQLCQESAPLTEGTRELSQRLFGFRDSEAEYLFDWIRGLSPPCPPTLDAADELQRDLREQLVRLNELMFTLADQEGVRARLACSSPAELVASARNLYLESCVAQEAIFLTVDQRCKHLLGVAAQGQARRIGELDILLADDASLASRSLLKGEALDSSQTQRPLSVNDQLFLRLCRSAEIYCQPFRFAGRLLGVVILGFNCQRELEEFQSLRLQMVAKIISESLAQLDVNGVDPLGEGVSLVRRVSHEVSNPLTVIGNYAEVLTHLLADTENRELSESIKKEVRRIDDILTYYLNQQELPDFPGSGLCLNQLLRDTLDTLTPGELEPRNIRVELKLQADLAKVSTNALLVKQILINLIKNAAEAIDKDGKISFLTHDSYCSDGKRYAEMLIQDDGPGVDALVQKKLFKPIVSTKGPGHAGVGLSIVKAMTDDLKGQISYYDLPGAGAGFRLQIPVGDVFPEVN